MQKQNLIDFIIDLLVEFDEMGFAPTTTVPDPEAYAIEWKRKLTEALKDYLKQIVAEWKAGNENGQYGYYCSNCKAGFTGENAEWIAKEHDFCPKCGAKMEGGTE